MDWPSRRILFANIDRNIFYHGFLISKAAKHAPRITRIFHKKLRSEDSDNDGDHLAAKHKCIKQSRADCNEAKGKKNFLANFAKA